jgi:alpha-glucosidase
MSSRPCIASTDWSARSNEFLRRLPVAWDDTRLVDGKPGRSVVLARRKGSDWYLAAINGQKQPARVSAPLRFLGEGVYEGVLISDQQSRVFASRPLAVNAGDKLDINMLAYGGCVLHLKPNPR